MAAYSLKSAQIQSPISAFNRSFYSASTDILAFLPQLDELLIGENSNGYEFRASTRAYELAKAYLEAANAILGHSFIVPDFTSDGERGIEIEWRRNARIVTLSCRGKNDQNDYVYWQEEDKYDAKPASLALLIDRLDWLTYA